MAVAARNPHHRNLDKNGFPVRKRKDMPDFDVRSLSRGGANFLNRFKHIHPSGKINF
jgi:hypothetical protein